MSAPLRGAVLLVAFLLAAAPLSLLIAGTSWLVVAGAAAGSVIGSGILLRLLVRRTPLVIAGQLLAIVLLILATELATGLLAPADLVSPAAVVTAQADSVTAGIVELGAAVPPVLLGGPGMLVLVLLLALVALVLDQLFSDLGQGAATALALLGFALSPALSVPGGGPGWTLAGPVAGAVLVLGAPALRRVRTAAVLAATGALVLAAGPVVGEALPARSPAPYPLTIRTLDGLLGRGTDISPVMIDDSVSVRRDLLRARETEVLRFATDDPDPGYLRLHTLTTYRDGNWSVGTRTALPFAFSDRVQEPAPADGRPRYDIAIFSLVSDTLPAPAGVRWVDPAAPELREGSATDGDLPLAGPARALDGTRYTVEIEPPPFGAEQLRAVTVEQMSDPIANGYITLATSPPPIATALADRIVADSGATTPYDTARAFEDYFRSEFTYDLAARSAPGEDPVAAFL